MDGEKQKPSEDSDSLESLEDQGTVVESGGSAESSSSDASKTGSSPAAPPSKKAKGPKFGGLGKVFGRFNIYLLLFLFVVVIGILVAVVAYFQNKKGQPSSTIQSQSLSQSTLEQLANSDATVGDPKQVLNVQSNAVFAGNVLVRDGLEVAGQLKVGGSLSLSGITVAGSSQFDQVQINKNLSVAGSAGVNGSLTVQQGLQVNGSGTFNGPISTPQLTASTIQLNGPLTLTHHVTAGGPIPSRTTGNAVGSGGTSSISGSDTSGSITIGTGSGASAGCFITVNFAQKFNTTPHVIVTPIGSVAGSLEYYVNRSTGSFSVCSDNAPDSFRSFGFDYIVLD